MSTSIVPKSAADLMESGTADLIAAGKEVAAGVMQSLTGEQASRPSSITLTQTLNVGGRTYYERPFDNNKSCAEEVCGCCCYTPNITTYYADASSMVQIGEKDGQKCCCCTAPPKPPKGELHAGYQVVGKGTISPWKAPCCFCLQQTPQMNDPSVLDKVEKTYYVPTAVVKDIEGNPVFEMRIRSANQNICASCVSCIKLECCNPECCGLMCFSCCGPCCETCFQCSNCCNCKSCMGCCKCFGSCCGPCKGCCEMGCPACYDCIFMKYSKEPTYTVYKQPIYRAGTTNTKDSSASLPVGFVKSIWLGSKPFSVAIDAPGTTAEEQALLLVFAWAIVEKTNPEDPTKVGFVHDTKTNFTNQYFETVQKEVKFDEVLKLVVGGSPPGVAEMLR